LRVVWGKDQINEETDVACFWALFIPYISKALDYSETSRQERL